MIPRKKTIPLSSLRHFLPGRAVTCLAVEDSWNQVWWLRIVKPWFDTVPSSYWAKINGRVPIEFWGLNMTSVYTNQQGNISRLFTWMDDQLYATYGVRACFIMGSPNCDTTLATCPSFLGVNEWFGPPNLAYTMTSYKGAVWGGIAAGFINWRYYEPTDPNYQSPNYVLRRNGVDGTGANGDTLKSGLEAAVANNAKFSIIEGWINKSEYNGLYRSASAPEWDFPNQYINMVRRYTDLRTATTRLEAEAADSYVDTTAGNSGGAFLRDPEDLDVRALNGDSVATASSVDGSNAPANAFDGNLGPKWVSQTAAPAWLCYDYGSGNSEIVTRYYVASSDAALASAPKSWQFQGSNDGSNWVTLNSQTGQAFTTQKETKEYAISNGTSYRFYRINVTEVSGGGANKVAIGELRLMGTNAKGGGWAVTNTAAGETIEFLQLSFSQGNYKFPVRYSASTAGKRLRLYVDGAALPDVTLPATGSMNAFDTISLGQRTLSHGLHDLKIQFVDGGVDLDWLFVKKVDALISLRASNGSYVCAEGGGNSTIVANRSAIGSWEKFSANDHNGGALSHNDEISLQAWNGLLLCAVNGGGAGLTPNKRALGAHERFTLIKTNGTGAIANGDTIALRSASGRYVTTVSTTTVDVSGTSIGAAQTFTVTLNPQ